MVKRPQSTFGYAVNGKLVFMPPHQRNKTKKRRPVLRFHDLSREDPHILLMNDAEASSSSLYWEDPHLLMSDGQEHQSDWEEEVEVAAVVVLEEDYDHVSIDDFVVVVADKELSSLIGGQQDDQIEESVNSDGAILNLQEREFMDQSSPSSSSTDWSMLSEVSSVVTFESSMVVRSFKDVLLVSNSNTGTSNMTISPVEGVPPLCSSNHRPKLIAIQDATDSSEDDGEESVYFEQPFHYFYLPAFDPYKMMDGVKGARGGRYAQMFKGNSRTCPNGSRRHGHKRKVIPRVHKYKSMV
jgi:hypothetical protein